MPSKLGYQFAILEKMEWIRYKSDGMSEDDQKFWESEVQEMTDDYVKRIDSFLNTKQDEIMQV